VNAEDDLDKLEALGARLRRAVAEAYEKGWRVADLEWIVRRHPNRRTIDLFDHLADGPVKWAEKRGLPIDTAIAAASLLALSLEFLPPLPDVVDTRDTVDSAVVTKVRALLAKAESTTFPAEAEALTAKAYELMDRYTIGGLVEAGASGSSDVVAARVFVDDPYARAKFVLLSEVARACGCRVVMWTGMGLATVFGHAADVDAAVMLYGSLTVQAASGLRAASAGASNVPGQKAAFRRAYLLGFARAIGARLRVAHDEGVADAVRDHGESLLPVLAAREAAVDAAVDALGKLRHMQTRASNGAGWAAGADAGNRATLVHQRPLPTGPGALPAGA
jgi:hypothetical protein